MGSTAPPVEDEDEWEYEYSTTETEVGHHLFSFL